VTAMSARVRAAVSAAAMLVIAFPLAGPVRQSLSAPRSAEGEHEALVYRGITACGVERWAVKVRRVGALYDCLTEAKSSRGG
jgi:hypothetical protein